MARQREPKPRRQPEAEPRTADESRDRDETGAPQDRHDEGMPEFDPTSRGDETGEVM